jgi:S-DNA-T family DNA segregation ATPase FtsK/SpoIIIE
VRAGDRVEFQLAQVRADSAAHVRTIATRWSGCDIGTAALRFRPLPESVRVADCGPPGAELRLGVGGEEAWPVSIEPAATGHLLIAGSARSGRSTALLLLLAEARRVGMPVVVAAAGRSPLHERARDLGLPLAEPGASLAAAVRVEAGAAERPTVLLVDDCETFDGTVAGDELCEWLRHGSGVTAVVAGRAEALAAAYRGIAAEARRNRRGVLLQPAPLDGELLGVRLDRARPRERRPGRGIAVGLTAAPDGHGGGEEAVAVQLALPHLAAAGRGDQLPDMWGYR